MKYLKTAKYLQAGFTLLEVILVLFILAVITSTSLTFLENEDGQLRYDESIEKMKFVEAALLKKRIHKGQEFYTGFIFDNGTLPPDSQTDLTPLLSDSNSWSDVSGDLWLESSIIRAFYDLEDTGSSEQELADQSKFKLKKGFRGNYLVEGLDSNLLFKDGWKEDFLVSPDNVNLQFDLSFDGTNKANFSDATLSIVESDWTVEITDLDIRITNNSGSDISCPTICYELAVLVFTNDSVSDPKNRWETFHTSLDGLLDTNIFLSSAGSWEIKGSSLSAIDNIPVGEHLAIVINTSTSASKDGSTEIVDSQKFYVYPNTNQPEINLEIP